MNESEQDNGSHQVSEATDRKLRALGFDPGVPVFSITCNVQREQVQQALFESTYGSPIALPLSYTDPDETASPWELPMLVELVQALYTPFRIYPDDAPAGCHKYPSWYLRGFLHKSAFDPNPETIRMHVLFDVDPDEGDIETGILQLVRQPVEADPESPYFYGDHGPGQALRPG